MAGQVHLSLPPVASALAQALPTSTVGSTGANTLWCNLVPGKVVGEARLPGCNDTGEPTTSPDALVKVARHSGVDPEIAIVDAMTPEVIYIRSDLDPLSEQLAEFFDRTPVRIEGKPDRVGGAVALNHWTEPDKQGAGDRPARCRRGHEPEIAARRSRAGTRRPAPGSGAVGGCEPGLESRHR